MVPTEEYWSIVSPTARNFVATCLTVDPAQRPTAEQMLEHEWLTSEVPHFVENETGEPRDLLPHVRKAFDARRTCSSHVPYHTRGNTERRDIFTVRKAVLGMMAMKRMTTLAHPTHVNSMLSPEARKLGEDLHQFKEESAKEVLEDIHVIHHHNADEEHHLNAQDDISVAKGPNGKVVEGSDVTEKLAAVSLAVKLGAAKSV